VVDLETAPLAREDSKHRDALSLADLTDASWISPNPDGRGVWLKERFAEFGLSCHDVIECDSFAASFDLVQQMDRLVWLPTALTQSELVGVMRQQRGAVSAPMRRMQGVQPIHKGPYRT
jgi:hypothetical protein